MSLLSELEMHVSQNCVLEVNVTSTHTDRLHASNGDAKERKKVVGISSDIDTTTSNSVLYETKNLRWTGQSEV